MTDLPEEIRKAKEEMRVRLPILRSYAIEHFRDLQSLPNHEQLIIIQMLVGWVCEKAPVGYAAANGVMRLLLRLPHDPLPDEFKSPKAAP